jgi:hypothetical protein
MSVVALATTVFAAEVMLTVAPDIPRPLELTTKPIMGFAAAPATVLLTDVQRLSWTVTLLRSEAYAEPSVHKNPH